MGLRKRQRVLSGNTKLIKDNNIYVMKYIKLFESYDMSYDAVLKKQQVDSYYDFLFSKKDAKFKEEVIDIDKLRDINGMNEEDNTEVINHTVTYFDELGMDEDYSISKELMDKIVDGVNLNPIVVDNNYKLLDGRHRLAAYSELWFYYGYDFPFDGKIKIYRRDS